MTRNICDLVDPPAPNHPTHSVWDADQVKTFLQFIKNDRLYPLYVLATTGMRLGELLGIRYQDVDWQQGAVHVSNAIQYIAGQGIIQSEPKTDNAKRTIKLPAFVLAVLKSHVGRTGISQGFLFQTKNGTPFSPRNIQRHFARITDEAGLPPIRFHDLRHTTATLLLLQGTHPKLVQELLGHSSIVLTLDTYSHVIPAMHGEIADTMNALLKV